MRHPLALVLLCAALGAASCSRPRAPEDSGRAVPVQRLTSDPSLLPDYTGLAEPRRTVVRDEAAWREVWSAIWRMQSPQPPLPRVDFAREMLAVVALGDRPNGGFRILADSAFLSDSGLVIRVRTISPGAGCVTTQALTRPVDVVRVPRTDGAVHFRDRAEVDECR